MKQYVISLVLLIAALVAFPTSNANAQSQAEMNKAGSVQDSVRVYDITATIGVDGKATIDTKLVEKESY
jgi:hypothetical protein